MKSPRKRGKNLEDCFAATRSGGVAECEVSPTSRWGLASAKFRLLTILANVLNWPKMHDRVTGKTVQNRKTL